eukprot:g45321.t1
MALNGPQEYTIVVDTDIDQPHSLVLQPLNGKLLWADGQLHCIGVANLDGTNIKVMHEILQPQVYNPCEEMGCKHFCLLGPGLKGSCQCGPGMLLADDGLTCLKSEDQPFLLMISPTVLLQVYLKHLQPDTGLKALPEHLAYHLINNQVASADYVWKDKLVYFSDSEEGIVGNVMLGGDQKTRRLAQELNVPKWMGKNEKYFGKSVASLQACSLQNLVLGFIGLIWVGHNVIDSVLLDGSEFREIQVGLEAQSVFAYGEDILFWTTIHDGYTRMWYSMMGQKKQLWFEVQQKIVGLKVYSRQQQQVLLVVVGTIIFKKKRAAKRRARANLQQTTGRGNQTFRNEAFVEVPE